ncbi:MAG TPA: hypothetical protein DD624_04040 [Alphaproteobacteria bacterium]|nr:hypothetical protein [Alphaproteobacteria bacterium]
MTSVKIEGRQKVALAVSAGYDFQNLEIQGRPHFDLKFFLLLGLMTYGMVYTFIAKKKLYDESVPKLKNVEFLRLLFTFGIVAHHMTPVIDFFNEGWLCVEFFFLLSGFFLMITFKPEKTAKGFVKSKIIHFIPLTAAVALFNGKIALIPTNMLFLQGTGLAAAVPPQGWYLGVLFWVSLFYFYILKVFKPEISKLTIALITFFAYCAFKNGWSNALLSSQLIRGLAGIGLGCFLGCFWRSADGKSGYAGKTGVYTVAEIVFLLYSVGLMFVKPLYPANRITAVLSFAILIVLFVLKRGKVSQFFEKPFWARISCCSFAIYMVHENLIRDITFTISDKCPVLAQKYAFVFVAATLALSYLLGLLARRYVEIPSTRWLKRKTEIKKDA